MPNKCTSCPCQSKQSYALCCGRYHKGKLHAPTAEALMRARYSAYVLGNAQYLFRTWDKSTRPTLQSLRDAGAQTYTSLKIISTSKGGIIDDTGSVEFIATLENNGQIETLHEMSKFTHSKGKWAYIDAV